MKAVLNDRAIIAMSGPEAKTFLQGLITNDINRLAAKFPVAHTADPETEVEVWCANDYLGMGNNPVVLETMQ